MKNVKIFRQENEKRLQKRPSLVNTNELHDYRKKSKKHRGNQICLLIRFCGKKDQNTSSLSNLVAYTIGMRLHLLTERKTYAISY